MKVGCLKNFEWKIFKKIGTVGEKFPGWEMRKVLVGKWMEQTGVDCENFVNRKIGIKNSNQKMEKKI